MKSFGESSNYEVEKKLFNFYLRRTRRSRISTYNVESYILRENNVVYSRRLCGIYVSRIKCWGVP